jgi:hypothetical protein
MARSTRATAAATAAPAVIYVHGIGRQPASAQVKLDWDLALFGRDMADRTRMAYWADVREDAAGAESTRARTEERRGRAARAEAMAMADPSCDQEEVLEEADRGDAAGDPASLVETSGVRPRQRKQALEYATAVANKMAAHAPLTASFRAAGLRAKVLPVPEWVRRRVTAAITRLFIRDSAAYFFDAPRRQRIQEHMRRELEGAAGPVVLVSHSQGSIVAFDVLSALGASVDVSLWVTLGSPLGIREVQDHLGPLVAPRAVRVWRNFADLLDPVALDKQLANDFSVGAGQFIRDEAVVNADSGSLIGFNPHSATGYLSTAPVRQAVSAATGIAFDPLVFGGFFRRDVLQAMRDRVTRHPVLVELRDPDAFGRASEIDHLTSNGGEDRRAQARVVRRVAASRDQGMLQTHRDSVVKAIESVIGERYGRQAKAEIALAQIDPLRRFVAARLTTVEMQALALRHGEHIYCVWKNTQKRKLIHRSTAVVHVPAARIAYGAQGEGVTWAVLDTGVAGKHPHFKTHDTIADVWDCTKVGRPRAIAPPDSRDSDGHGTHVCGIVAGVEAGGSPAAPRHEGVAPRARLRVYKVLDDNGEGEDGWIIKALDHIGETNERASGLVIHGVNLSLGGPFDAEVYGTGHSPICQELRRLWRQGVLACVACGNEGEIVVTTPDGEFNLRTQVSIGDPANLEECIAVGSVNADKPHLYGISYFSSRGPTADGRVKPDCVAPGEGIESCGTSWRRTPYVKSSGTSMACPHVSGLLAAFLSVRREFIGRPDEVKRLLLANCTDLGRERTHQGFGIPNLLKMLSST